MEKKPLTLREFYRQYQASVDRAERAEYERLTRIYRATHLTEAVRRRCREELPGEIELVPRIAPDWAEPAACFKNAARAEREDLGARVTGWEVEIYPDVALNLVPHALVRLPGGQHLCVTPSLLGVPITPFIPDATRRSDPPTATEQPIPRRICLSDTKLARDFLALNDEIDAMRRDRGPGGISRASTDPLVFMRLCARARTLSRAFFDPILDAPLRY